MVDPAALEPGAGARPSVGPSSRRAATAWATWTAEPRSSLIRAVNHVAYSSVTFTAQAKESSLELRHDGSIWAHVGSLLTIAPTPGP